MGLERKPFQGVINIIRFNWHFYLIALLLILGAVIVTIILPDTIRVFLLFIAGGTFFAILLSLIVSFYVYDLSDLYDLKWIEEDDRLLDIVNIHAGFDETSALIQTKFTNGNLKIFDFYDPILHTEVSVKRAREAYSAQPGTIRINTSDLPLKNNSIDIMFLIFAAHEIRNDQERSDFFKLLESKIKPAGKIYIVEHLRDFQNFLAYNIGFFHFYSKANWIKIFKNSGLHIIEEQKLTPFISSFILNKYGNSF